MKKEKWKHQFPYFLFSSHNIYRKKKKKKKRRKSLPFFLRPMNNDFGHDWLNNPLLFNMELIDDLLVEF